MRLAGIVIHGHISSSFLIETQFLAQPGRLEACVMKHLPSKTFLSQGFRISQFFQIFFDCGTILNTLLIGFANPIVLLIAFNFILLNQRT